MRIYISGPMSGLPENNYPAFHAEAKRLRALSFVVENPAENLGPDSASWQWYMRRAVAQLVTCDAIHLLPGWSTSRGARVEYELARALGMDIYGSKA